MRFGDLGVSAHGLSWVFGSLWGIGHASGPILTSLFLSRRDYVPAFGVVSLMLLAATALFQLFVKTSPGAA
jgi:DHA1 family multidrug resistance protein-like MFS transporter